MNSHSIWPEIAEALRVILPVILSVIAAGRAERAHNTAKQALAACSFPQCGHVCTPQHPAKEGS
jgi:hypothetical protein